MFLLLVWGYDLPPMFEPECAGICRGEVAALCLLPVVPLKWPNLASHFAQKGQSGPFLWGALWPRAFGLLAWEQPSRCYFITCIRAGAALAVSAAFCGWSE